MRFLLPPLLATTALQQLASASSIANSPLLSRVSAARHDHVMDVLPTVTVPAMSAATVLPTVMAGGVISTGVTNGNQQQGMNMTSPFTSSNSTVTGTATQSVPTDFTVFPGQNDGKYSTSSTISPHAIS